MSISLSSSKTLLFLYCIGVIGADVIKPLLNIGIMSARGENYNCNISNEQASLAQSAIHLAELTGLTGAAPPLTYCSAESGCLGQRFMDNGAHQSPATAIRQAQGFFCG